MCFGVNWSGTPKNWARALRSMSEKSWESARTAAANGTAFWNREHLLGVAVYDLQGKLVAITPELQPISELLRMM